MAPSVRVDNATTHSSAINKRLLLVIGSILYAVVLNWSYANVESFIFEYVGLAYRPPDLEAAVLLYLIGATPMLWMPLSINRPSCAAYLVFYCLTFVPFVHIGYHVMRWPAAQILWLDLFLLANMAWLGFWCWRKPIALRAPRISQAVALRGLAVVTVVIAVAVLALNEFRFELSLAEAYERRFTARESVSSGSLASYATSNLTNALMPIAIAAGISFRRWWLIAAGLFATGAVFSLAGQKQALFTPLFIFALLFLCRRKENDATFKTLALFASFVLIGAILVLFRDSVDFSAIFTFRLLAATARIAADYYDFFSTHDHFYFAHSLLKGVVTTSYDFPMALELGRTYGYVGEQTSLNTNSWVSMYGEVGFVGIPIAATIMGVYFWVLDSLAEKGPRLLFVLMGGMVGFFFSEAALTTTLITGGLILGTILLFLLRSEPATQVPGAA